MYFGRNSYDPQAIAEAQTRLQSFQGAQSISSNQYFGREEEEDMGVGHPTDGGLLGDGTLAGLELAARDAVSKVLARAPPRVQRAMLFSSQRCITSYLGPEVNENDMLDIAFGLTDTSRLGCQVKLTKELDGLVATLPSAKRNMFVDGTL